MPQGPPGAFSRLCASMQATEPRDRSRQGQDIAPAEREEHGPPLRLWAFPTHGTREEPTATCKLQHAYPLTPNIYPPSTEAFSWTCLFMPNTPASLSKLSNGLFTGLFRKFGLQQPIHPTVRKGENQSLLFSCPETGCRMIEGGGWDSSVGGFGLSDDSRHGVYHIPTCGEAARWK